MLRRKLQVITLVAAATCAVVFGMPGTSSATIGGQPLFVMDIISNVPFIGYWCPSAGNTIDTQPAGPPPGHIAWSAGTYSRGGGFCGTYPINLSGPQIAVDDVAVWRNVNGNLSVCVQQNNILWNTAGSGKAVVHSGGNFCGFGGSAKIVSWHYYVYPPTGQNDWDMADGGWVAL